MSFVLSRPRSILRRMGAVAAATAVSLSMVGVSALTPASAAQVHYTTPPIQSWRLNGQGFAVLVVGDIAYVGGQFTTARSFNGQTTATRLDLSAFNVNTGDLVTSFRADTDGVVRSLATDGTRLFVGGDFSSIGGHTVQNLAALDLTTGDVDTSWDGGANNVVWALAADGGRLYLGGAFNRINGVSRPRLGAVDAASGALDPFAPAPNGQIRALAVDAGQGFVYAGGRHTTMNGQPSAFLSKLTLDGQLTPVAFPELGDYGQGLSLNADGSRIAAAGADNRIHYFNTATGDRLWRQFCQGNAQATKVIDDTVVGGYHDGCNNVDGRDLILINADTGDRDESFLPTFDQFWGVRAIDGNASVLAVAGKMTSVDGQVIGSFAIFPAG